MISRLMLNLHENANAGIYSASPQVFSTHMEYRSPPLEVELDTIMTTTETSHLPRDFESQDLIRT